MTRAADTDDREAPARAEPPTPRHAPEWVIGALRPAVIGLSRALWRINYDGFERVPAEGGLIIASNHQTYFDPFWVGARMRRPVRFLAWDESLKWPLLGKMMGTLGAWPVVLDRGNPTAYRRSMRWLRSGGALMIFPEGERAYAGGELTRFKAGAVRLALEAGVPILPVTISGGERVWPRGQAIPRAGRVRVTFHPLRRPACLPGEEPRQCVKRETEALAAVIKSAL